MFWGGPSSYTIHKNTKTLVINFDDEVYDDEHPLAGRPHILVATIAFQWTDNYTLGIRKKTLNTAADLNITEADIFSDAGRNYILLNHADVLRINTITTSTGTNVLGDFLFDNGQRDYTYEFGRLYFLKSKEDDYKTDGAFDFDLTVTYDYFDHGQASGCRGKRVFQRRHHDG
jgi:hypothetical protein